MIGHPLLRFVTVLLFLLALPVAIARSDAPQKDEEAIGEYLFIRDELMLKKKPDDLDKVNVLGLVSAAEEYLFHTLERDNWLKELYRVESNPEKVSSAFKRRFAQQAIKYKKSYEGVRVDFKAASDSELVEAREAYRFMVALIRRSESSAAELLNVDFRKLAESWKTRK